MDDYSDGRRDTDAADNSEITDGWGNYWSVVCPQCGKPAMAVVRPGKAACQDCDGCELHGQGAIKEL